jgi:integrase
MVSRRGSIKKEKNGTFSAGVDVQPPGARRRTRRKRGFATKRAAQAWITEVLGSVAHATFVEPSQITVTEWFETWVGTLDLAPATVASYANTLRLHVEPDLGAGRLQALGTADIDRVYSRLRSEGRLSARSIRYVHVVVKSALATAVRKCLLVVNPADAASPPPESAARAPEMLTWSPAQMRTFLEHELVRADRLFPQFRVACMTGLRRGEQLALIWPDFEPDRISVRRQVVMIDGTPTITDVKTPSSRRSVALDAETVTILHNHRRRQLEERLAYGAGYADNGLIFAKLDGTLIPPWYVSRRFDWLVRKVGLPRIRFHDIRHSHAAALIKSGTHAKAVSARLGHSSTSFTLDKYGHVLEGLDADAADAAARLVDEGER